MAVEPGSLLKILRVRDGLAVTVGIIIGVGILRTPGLIAGYLGNPWAMLGVWAFGGIVVILSTLVLAEMAAALPQAGGKYVYAREAYGPQVGFVVGWSELLVTRGFSGAAKAVVIAEYLVLQSRSKLHSDRGHVMNYLANACVHEIHHMSIKSLRRVEVKYHDILRLPVTVDSADTLHETHRVPGQVVVDHDMAAAMQVETFSAGLSRN